MLKQIKMLNHFCVLFALLFLFIGQVFASDEYFSLKMSGHDLLLHCNKTGNTHIYWKKSGDAGVPTEIKLDKDSSQNVEDITVAWPYPVTDSLTNEYSEYEKVSAYLDTEDSGIDIPIYVKVLDEDSPVRVALHLDYVTCGEVCSRQSQNIKIDIPPLFFKNHEYDKLSSDNLNLEYDVSGDGNPLVIKMDSFDIAADYGEWDLASIQDKTGDGVEKRSPILLMLGDKFILPARVKVWDNGGRPNLSAEFFDSRLVENIQRENGGDLNIIFKNSNNKSANINVNVKSIESDAYQQHPMWMILIMALAGGMILNLMPCVLSVLGIKIMQFMKAVHRTEVRGHAVAAALGSIMYFVVIGVIVAVVKMSDGYYTIGMSMQNPKFVCALCVALTIIISMSFERLRLPTPTIFWRITNTLSKSADDANRMAIVGGEYIGTFLSSIVSAILGSACSAPLLATSMGAALTSSVDNIMMIYVMAGIGFASPYLLIAAKPEIANVFPRSGAWNAKIKTVISFLLFLTLMWLLYVVYSALQLEAALSLFGICLLVKFVIEYKDSDLDIRDNVMTKIVSGGSAKYTSVLLLLIASVTVPYRVYENFAHIDEYKDNMWKVFSQEAIDKDIADGKIVFLDFTATWCATCKYNKLMVMNTIRMANLLREHNVQCYRADLTYMHDSSSSVKSTEASGVEAEIRRYMFRHYVAGIPYNVIYGPNNREGVVLRTMFGVGDVEQVITKVSK